VWQRALAEGVALAVQQVGGGVHTVNGDGNALAQDVAVGALERRDLSKLVEQQVVGRDALLWHRVDNLDLELVGLCYSLERSRARVTLAGSVRTGSGFLLVEVQVRDIRSRCRAFRTP
jgi:hypothetical protein